MPNVSKQKLLLWLCSVLPLAVAGPAKADPILDSAPMAVRTVAEQTFPAHRVLRMVQSRDGSTTVFRLTLFSPTDAGFRGKKEGDDMVSEILLYRLEVTAEGKVLEEARHPIALSQLPQAVLDGYRKWNPRGVTGMGSFWAAEQQSGKERVFIANVVPNSVTRHWAVFSANGSLISASPARVP